MTQIEVKHAREKGWQPVVLNVLGGLAVAGVALVLITKAFGMRMFYDEFLHLHNLWLVANGFVPHADFWCNYPALGYVILLPHFKMMPESIYVLVALRLLGLACLAGMAVAFAAHARRLEIHWAWGILPLAIVLVTPQVASLVVEFRTDPYAAALAILALVLLFREPSPGWTFLAATLSVLSLAIMPKYFYTLLLANVAHAAYGWFQLKQGARGLATLAAGALSGLALAQALLWLIGVSLGEDFYWSSILMKKYFAHRIATDDTVQHDAHAVTDYFLENPWVAFVLLLGLSGWAVTEYRRRRAGLWVGIAILFGVTLTWETCLVPYRQYVFPGLLCLVLFVPYLGAVLRQPALHVGTAVLLAVLALESSRGFFQDAVSESANGSALADLRSRERLLGLIPRSERVVGIHERHPTFRRDQTFVTYDERFGRPRGFTSVLQERSTVWNHFQPQSLEASLTNAPPAAIAYPSSDYPPGWNETLERFLRERSDDYERIRLNEESRHMLYVRKDVLNARKVTP